MEAESLLADALAELGVHAHAPGDSGVDLVLEPGGIRAEVKRLTLVTDDAVRRLLKDRPGEPGSVLLVVGDRVTSMARELLLEHGAGYYDLRGHLALRSPSIVIDTDLEPVAARAERTDPLAGKAGLEVATALLMRPSDGAGVRELARMLGRSASTVSEVLASLRRAGLVEAGNSVADDQLFWRVAERWPAGQVDLARLPEGDDPTLVRPLRLGLDDAENSTGWALSDSAAAVAYGAPLAVRAGQPLNFYVPDTATLRRATTLLGAAPARSLARCSVQVAPVPAVCAQRVQEETSPFGWPLAHPVFVALDLARDAGRGREILDAWTPGPGWARVW